MNGIFSSTSANNKAVGLVWKCFISKIVIQIIKKMNLKEENRWCRKEWVKTSKGNKRLSKRRR